MSDLHRTFVERLSQFTWQAQCSCGWRGPRRRLLGLSSPTDADAHLLAQSADQPKDCGGSGFLHEYEDGDTVTGEGRCPGCSHPDCPNRDQTEERP